MVGNRKNETVHHNVLKHLIAALLRSQGHVVEIEAKLSKGFRKTNILDVWDHSDEIGYEIQSKFQEEIEKTKVLKYTKVVGVRDIIFIYTKDFPLYISCEELIELIKEKLGWYL